uniref:Uncharacterized protein n=1 Tax=Castor canadensis TaxID=51338 RepID=A0A8C0XPQ8_CASCN
NFQTSILCFWMVGGKRHGDLKLGCGSRTNLHSQVPCSISSHLITFTLMNKSLEDFYM